jgi:hypothetical protein
LGVVSGGAVVVDVWLSVVFSPIGSPTPDKHPELTMRTTKTIAAVVLIM